METDGKKEKLGGENVHLYIYLLEERWDGRVNMETGGKKEKLGGENTSTLALRLAY